MCDNYWVSSQYKWQQNQYYKKQQQSSTSQQTQPSAQQFDTHDDSQFNLFEKQLVLMHCMRVYLRDVGKKVNAHQRVIATAMIYCKRFYCQNSISDCDPALLSAAALLLASKIEECPLNAKNIHQIAMGKDSPSPNYDTKETSAQFPYQLSQIIECELYLMEQLSFNLTIFHPYNSLIMYVKDSEIEKAHYQMAWNIVNDSYFSDVVLKYAPYLISLTSIYMTCILTDNKEKARKWFDQLYVDMKVIGDIADEILTMYSLVKKMLDPQSDVHKTLNQALLRLQQMRQHCYWGTP
ncbi:hypothetical protein FDP41_002550 [Naegleria fowleri]|uniref:Cyclin-like domain-containing protein n=1 Tax=Naegleria fowleri TaxID=5763 RepID=A0A6A5BYT5_NAEFO|nr:uncharacterized protein FDP41_002550 [Naegleria fowleri]KAF0978730.1 hypothetical protein FDP41_002550 [Naegleria fowleri]